jgi:predicted transcriptional regulator
MYPQQRDYHEQASTLIITVESEEEFYRGVREGIKALEQDETAKVDSTPVVSFTNYDHLLRTITPETPELIETVRRTEPSSINETAKSSSASATNRGRRLRCVASCV